MEGKAKLLRDDYCDGGGTILNKVTKSGYN